MRCKDIPKPNVESPAEHSIYSPSGSKRWMKCPASIKVIKELDRPEGEASFFAEEGTAAHELAAHCLGEEVQAESVIGQTFNSFIVDKEMARKTQVYIDYVNGQFTWDSNLWVENRLSLEHLQEGMFGTADAVIISDSTLEVIDLKYGRGVVVEVEHNTQLMIYTLGVLAHLKKHNVTFPDHFDVKMTIVQPRAPHSQGPIRSEVMTISQLREFQATLVDAIADTKKDDPVFGPTEEGCRWCEAAPTCKAFANYNLAMAKLEFADFKLSPKKFKHKLFGENTYTIEEMTVIMEHSKAIEQWVKSISSYVLEQLKTGNEVPGYKLVYGRSNRAWKNQTEAERILEEYGTDHDRVFKSKFVSPAQAEKELTETEWELIKDLIHKPKGNITVAKESDKRAAIDKDKEAIDEWGDEKL